MNLDKRTNEVYAIGEYVVSDNILTCTRDGLWDLFPEGSESLGNIIDNYLDTLEPQLDESDDLRLWLKSEPSVGDTLEPDCGCGACLPVTRTA